MRILGIQPKYTIYDASEKQGIRRFERANFVLPFKGQNQDGVHDDLIKIHFYEPSGNQNVFNETLLKSQLSTQVQPETLPGFDINMWPCDISMWPDEIIELPEADDGEVDYKVYIWDKNIASLTLDLKPTYEIDKVIYILPPVHVLVIHELHILCHNPIQL